MSKLTDHSGRPHSGMVAHPVSAIVVDNVDPDEQGRIKVKFPHLFGEPESFWIRQASPNAGKERGLYALPEKEDEVLVIFMHGSQDIGIIIGQFWNGEDLPPVECKSDRPKPADSNPMTTSTDKFAAGSSDLANNDRRFWRSRSGHLFIFDDTDGEETVQIWNNTWELGLIFDSADGRIILSNSKGDIHIRAKENLFLESGKDLKYEVGQHMIGNIAQDHKVEIGMNYKAKAGMAVKMEAGTNFDVKAGINFKADAVQATLQGSAMAVVKAGLVKIN